ncbi:hypothetical protein [Streptomyces sp. NPDC048665]|uniref:hypothetical protein n=1 Tax=Streptomyces sp. NPDC048665 TaxID=3155490 RepID=UPI0034351BED
MLEERAAAGGDDADDSRAEDRAVHAEVRRQLGRHDRRQGAARDLGDAQVDPPATLRTTLFGRYTHTRNLPFLLIRDDALVVMDDIDDIDPSTA